jgi:hypothetical protein
MVLEAAMLPECAVAVGAGVVVAAAAAGVVVVVGGPQETH